MDQRGLDHACVSDHNRAALELCLAVEPPADPGGEASEALVAVRPRVGVAHPGLHDRLRYQPRQGQTRVPAEAARVLRPGGRFAVSDVIADPNMDEATKADMVAWTGCIAGALTETEFRDALAAAGLVDVEIRHTHRVHEHAAAAIIRAHKLAEAEVAR